MSRPQTTKKFLKKCLRTSLALAIITPAFAEEQNMDLSQLEGIKSLQEADSLYQIWKSSLSEKDSDEGMEEDRYQGWRAQALNYLDDNGNFDWGYEFNAPAPLLQAPSVPGLSSTPNWSQIGPFTFNSTKNTGHNPGIGRLQTIEIDPNNNDILYVGAPAGGIWKSTDAGSTWNNIMTDVPNHGVSGISVSPSNSNLIVVVSGEGDQNNCPYGTGIYRSTDAGASWTKVQNYNATGKNIAFHPTNPNKVLAATNNAIYVSSDAGLTWTTISGIFSIQDVAWDKGNDDFFYYSKSTSATRYQISTGTSTNITGFATGSQVRIETSLDTPDSLYILTGSSSKLVGFYVWDKNSKSITQTYDQNSGGKNLLGYDNNGSWSSSGFPWYAMAFQVSDEDANLISAGSPLVWRSTDGGNTFTHGSYTWSNWKHPGYNHPDMHDFGYAGNKHYVISDGGIRVSSDSGQTYTDISHGISALSSYQWGQSPQDGSYQTTGLQDIGAFVQRGSDWYTTQGGDGWGGFVDVSDKTIMYFSYWDFGSTHYTQRSTTGEYKYATKVSSTKQINYISQSISNVNNMIGAAQSSGLHYSTDRGLSWIQSNISSGTGTSVCISPIDENIAWAVAGNKLYKSINKGQSWTQTASTLGSFMDVACDSQDKNVAWATRVGTVSAKVYKTTNGGTTWNNITGPEISGQSVRHVAHDHGTKGGIYIGTQTGVFYYDDDIATWVNWSTNFPWTQVQEMSVHQIDQKLRIASWGRGLWEADLYQTGGSSSTQRSSSIAPSSSLTVSSSTLSSSELVSSSLLSSSEALSSSQDLSSTLTSSSADSDICSGVDAWSAKTYEWSATKEYVTFNSKLFSHTNWASADNPEQNTSVWTFEGDCQNLSSSLISSSEMQSSSSEIIVPASSSNFKLLAQYEQGLLLVKNLNPKQSTHISIINSKGEVKVNKTETESELLVKIQEYAKGHYFLQVTQGRQTFKKQFVIK